MIAFFGDISCSLLKVFVIYLQNMAAVVGRSVQMFMWVRIECRRTSSFSSGGAFCFRHWMRALQAFLGLLVLLRLRLLQQLWCAIFTAACKSGWGINVFVSVGNGNSESGRRVGFESGDPERRFVLRPRSSTKGNGDLLARLRMQVLSSSESSSSGNSDALSLWSLAPLLGAENQCTSRSAPAGGKASPTVAEETVTRRGWDRTYFCVCEYRNFMHIYFRCCGWLMCS